MFIDVKTIRILISRFTIPTIPPSVEYRRTRGPRVRTFTVVVNARVLGSGDGPGYYPTLNKKTIKSNAIYKHGLYTTVLGSHVIRYRYSREQYILFFDRSAPTTGLCDGRQNGHGCA